MVENSIYLLWSFFFLSRTGPPAKLSQKQVAKRLYRSTFAVLTRPVSVSEVSVKPSSRGRYFAAGFLLGKGAPTSARLYRRRPTHIKMKTIWTLHASLFSRCLLKQKTLLSSTSKGTNLRQDIMMMNVFQITETKKGTDTVSSETYVWYYNLCPLYENLKTI